MKAHILTLAFAATLGTVALAHSGVKNEAVKARMALMGEIKDAMDVISGMAKGKMPFDATKAEAARAAVKDAADRIPAAFKAPETDPKSEALPAIWENWGEYVSASEDLARAASAMDVSSLDSLRSGLPEVGGTCRGCHKPFRLKK